jgi:hypothetical protein
LNPKRKTFLFTPKNRPSDLLEICALDFKRKFLCIEIRWVSATIGINRSIFCSLLGRWRCQPHHEKTVNGASLPTPLVKPALML